MTQTYSVIQINTDGGSRGNPGPAAIGAIAVSGNEVIFTLSQKIGVNTNNVAEYQAVISALKEFADKGITTEKLNFVLDSELVVRQITGEYKIKQPHLLELKKQISDLISTLKNENRFHSISFSNVLREKNKEADKLVNFALDN